MASETRGVWEIRTEKVERLFRQLDGMMLGCVLPPAAGIAAGVMARRAILADRKKQPEPKDIDLPDIQAHERGDMPLE